MRRAVTGLSSIAPPGRADFRGAARMAIAGLAAGLLLTGCASGQQAEQALAAQQVLVGMPTQTLLSCAGVPNARQSVDATEFFTYQSFGGGGGRGSGISIGAGGGGGNLGLGIGLGFPLGGGRSSGCVATFTIDQGRVSRLVYRDDADDPSACYSIVENCLALAAAQR